MEVLAPSLMFSAAPPMSKLDTLVLYKLPEPVLIDDSVAEPISRISARSSAVPHSGVDPFDLTKLLLLPMFSVFKLPVLCAYSKSPCA